MVHIKIKTLQIIPQHEQRSKEWFALRYTKLTSSDAATVIGTNPYSKPHELLFKKCVQIILLNLSSCSSSNLQSFQRKVLK